MQETDVWYKIWAILLFQYSLY